MSRLASSPTSAVVWNDPLFWRPKAVTGVFIARDGADIGRVVRGDITAAAFVAAHPPSNCRFAGASTAYDDQLDPLDFEGYVPLPSSSSAKLWALRSRPSTTTKSSIPFYACAPGRRNLSHQGVLADDSTSSSTAPRTAARLWRGAPPPGMVRREHFPDDGSARDPSSPAIAASDARGRRRVAPPPPSLASPSRRACGRGQRTRRSTRRSSAA